jgi:hypothetical protein
MRSKGDVVLLVPAMGFYLKYSELGVRILVSINLKNAYCFSSENVMVDVFKQA